ncbi:MAG: hypothetical protein JSU59_11240 [Nitrospirota bacterium]|nr:MAG: hypothetical protein JSU59_11240 [Nitrospirota bacterium]
MSKINVCSEWGELKEVVIGRPLDEDDCIFEWTTGMDQEFSWLKPDTFRFLKENSGKPWKNANPELFAKINDQVGYYVDTLGKHGVTVHRPDRLVNEDRNYINRGIEQIWPRDCFCTVGSTVIVASLRMPWKRKQQFSLARLYTQKLLAGECTYVSAPQPSTEILSTNTHEAEKTAILLDGGDFLVHGRDIYLGQGHGSNALGARFAQAALGEEYQVYPLKLADAALHLDCTIALVRPGLGIICRDWLVSELPPALQRFTWIEATAEEAAWLGVNGLPLNPETYLVDAAHTRIIRELRSHGVEVVEVPFDGPSYLGGSLRCASQPLIRQEI